jgi:hypothetical protein
MLVIMYFNQVLTCLRSPLQLRKMSNKIKVAKDDSVEGEETMEEDVTEVAAQGQSGDEAEVPDDLEGSAATGHVDGDGALENGSETGLVGKKVRSKSEGKKNPGTRKIKKLKGRKARKGMPTKEEIAATRYLNQAAVALVASRLNL